MFGWKYIFLCENFLKLTTIPLGPAKKYCPHITGNRFTVPAELQRLANYKTYVLIHEMVHFYVGKYSLGFTSIPPESYASNICVNFDMKTSLRSPMNFQYFVGMVDNKCTEAPNPFLPPFPLPPPNMVKEELQSNSTGMIDAF
ncbi:MAG: hypothetical protein Q9221_000820 [Calogaya cf. arnoldii]